MSATLHGSGYEDVRVVAGEKLVLRVRAHDPAGITKIFVQCFQFSLSSANRIKTAVGEASISPDEAFSVTTFDVPVHIPENAALGSIPTSGGDQGAESISENPAFHTVRRNGNLLDRVSYSFV